VLRRAKHSFEFDFRRFEAAAPVESLTY